jgi:hypothetical protein
LQVERALILWRDDHLEYDRYTLKHLRKTSAQDFSGTNYKSITRGWLERIREKRKKDNNFFAKVCKEARNLYFAAAGKGKSVTGSGSAEHSDVEIEERAGVMSDDSDDPDEGTSNIVKRMWDPASRDAMQDAANDGGAIDGANGNNGDDEDSGAGDVGHHVEEDNEADCEDEEEMYQHSGYATASDEENGNGSVRLEGFKTDYDSE